MFESRLLQLPLLPLQMLDNTGSKHPHISVALHVGVFHLQLPHLLLRQPLLRSLYVPTSAIMPPPPRTGVKFNSAQS